MKLLVLSDTHRRIDDALNVVKTTKNLDYIIHLGDLAADAKRLSEMLRRDVISVKGNCDGDFSERNYKILEAECGRILLIHGHKQYVKSGLGNLYYRTMELNCVAAFFGHTHVAEIVAESGITLINPGSIGEPRPGALPSYVIAETDKKEISASVKYIG